MAEHANTPRLVGSTSTKCTTSHWQDAISSFLGAALFLLAIACVLHAEHLVGGVQ